MEGTQTHCNTSDERHDQLPNAHRKYRCAGWNLVGFPYDEAIAVDDAIAGCGDQVKMLYAFDLTAAGGPWLKHKPGATGNDFDNLEPGRAYWVYTTTACTLGTE